MQQYRNTVAPIVTMHKGVKPLNLFKLVNIFFIAATHNTKAQILYIQMLGSTCHSNSSTTLLHEQCYTKVQKKY